LSIGGCVEPEEVLHSVRKWFGAIPPGNRPPRQLPEEPELLSPRRKIVDVDVPLDAFFLCFHCAARYEAPYHTDDLLTDILGGGESARLYHQLVKKQQLFTEIDAYLSGTTDKGLLVIEGKLSEETTLPQAEAAVWALLDELKASPLEERELQKLKNRVEHSLEFGEVSALNKTISLGYFELMGDAEGINTEAESYARISADDLHRRAGWMFRPERSMTLWYRAKKGSESSNS